MHVTGGGRGGSSTKVASGDAADKPPMDSHSNEVSGSLFHHTKPSCPLPPPSEINVI